ncbi:hypothetical protein B0H11DRAFT_2246228 [Mycena galericulata]|nr:hypothetical protein B0H11DRAFT_2246228 [Mycena galericulata]
MLWASKRRKSRPQLDASSSDLSVKVPLPLPPRRTSLGSTRLPFAPLDPQGTASDQAQSEMSPPAQNLYARPILTVDEQQRLARQSPSPPPNFSLPRRDPSSSSSTSSSNASPASSSSSRRGQERDSSDVIYDINSLASFAFGSASVAEPPPSPGRGIGPLEEDDEYDFERRRADETPRPSLANTARTGNPGRRDVRTPAAYYGPSNALRSDAASHHTFGTSSASSLSLSSPSPTRSRTTSSTTSVSAAAAAAEDLGGVTFNAQYRPPPPLTLHPRVEFDSEEEFSEDYDGGDDAIEVSSARGGGSVDGVGFDAAFERQVYSEPLSLFSAAPGVGRRPSLPMAIPGVPPDERREREGSMATVRRGSRSLDDQGNIASPSYTAGSKGEPVSVPETDGDWRSLSARAPSVPVIPTFAAPSPPTFNGPSFAPPRTSYSAPPESAGIDGFGFDPDWNAMQAGITGLDMSDIAVHTSSAASGTTAHSSASSSQRRPSQLSLMLRRPSTASGGSMMYDPDTFSAAVRGWGGEEYERQRKYWTFRRDAADGRGGSAGLGRHGGSITSPKVGAALGPVRSITQGRIGGGGKGTSMLSGGDQLWREWEWSRGEEAHAVAWDGPECGGDLEQLALELRPQKPQQRVTIDPFRGPYTLGPKPPHDGAYTNIHKHSKVMAFSIHRHYKPTRAPPVDVLGRSSVAGGRGSVSTVGGRGSVSVGHGSVAGYGTASRGSVSGAGRSGQQLEERRRPTAMILLAPRHVQEAYTSTNTTKGLRSHGLLDEGRDRDRDRDRSTGRDKDKDKEEGRRREKEKERERERERARQNGAAKSGQSRSQMSSTGSTTSTYRDDFGAPPPPAQHTYPPLAPAPLDAREGGFVGPVARPASSSRRRRRDSLEVDSDSETERVSSRTTHNEAFSTMDASSIDQMVLAQDARHGDNANGVLSRVLRRGPTHAPGPAAPHSVYIPPWVTLQSRVKQEERRRRHDVLSNSFEDVGLLPPKKSSGGSRLKKVPVVGVDIFAQVPSDALFMLLPLWPGPTDPVSERAATRPPHEIPTEQRQYLLVSYKPTDERPPPRKQDGNESSGRKKGSSHSSPTSSADNGGGVRGCDILLSSYHISARLVSHADLQGSGVRVPDEGLAVLGPWHEAFVTMPQIATRDHGLLVIGTCASREAGVEFDPEGLVKMGLCIPVPPAPNVDDELQEEPVAELTPIGKAVLEMAWIGCIAVTSFGPAASS